MCDCRRRWVNKKPSLLLLENKEKVSEIMANHGIINVRVAGSCVRGEDRMDSDIDFYVCLPEKNEEYGTPGPIIDAEEEIADLLNVRVQVIEEGHIFTPFRKTIETDAVLLADFRPGVRPKRGKNFKIAKSLLRLRFIEKSGRQAEEYLNQWVSEYESVRPAEQFKLIMFESVAEWYSRRMHDRSEMLLKTKNMATIKQLVRKFDCVMHENPSLDRHQVEAAIIALKAISSPIVDEIKRLESLYVPDPDYCTFVEVP